MNENMIVWASEMIWTWHESETSKTRLELVHLFLYLTTRSRTNFLFHNSEFRVLTKRLEKATNGGSRRDCFQMQMISLGFCRSSMLVQVQPLGQEPGPFWRANFAVMRTYPGQPSKVMTVNSVNMALPTLSKLKSCLFHSRFFFCKISKTNHSKITVRNAKTLRK